MTFSPLTLFRAPRNRSGPFNNIVVNGGFSASRLDRTQEESDGRRTEVASANSAVRIGSFGVSGRTNFNRNSVLPYQPLTGADATPSSASGSVAKLDLRSAGGLPDRPRGEHDASSHAERGRQPVSVGRHERGVHRRAGASPLRSRGVHRSLRVFSGRRPVRADPPQGLAAVSLRLFTGRGGLRFPACDPRVPVCRTPRRRTGFASP